MISRISEAAEYLKNRGITNPHTGIILGTGLGKSLVPAVQNPINIPYKDIPNFPLATVESHSGLLLYGDLRGKKVLIMQGRFHYYEGYSMEQVTLPVRVMKVLGIQQLFISNASGKLNPKWRTGELMLIDDHINLQPENPLGGKNIDQLGPRFPDMSRPYDASLNSKLIAIAKEKNIPLNVGVYVCVTGPNLETRAEYRFLRIIGADAVGMSTVPEVIIANHMNLPCCALSALTDDCDPDNLKPVELKDIIAIAEKLDGKLTELWLELLNA